MVFELAGKMVAIEIKSGATLHTSFLKIWIYIKNMQARALAHLFLSMEEKTIRSETPQESCLGKKVREVFTEILG